MKQKRYNVIKKNFRTNFHLKYKTSLILTESFNTWNSLKVFGSLLDFVLKKYINIDTKSIIKVIKVYKIFSVLSLIK